MAIDAGFDNLADEAVAVLLVFEALVGQVEFGFVLVRIAG